MNNISVLGIDLAKNYFQLHGIDQQGKVILKKRLTRDKLLPYIAQINQCLIGIEACGGSHYWARKFTSFGHKVKMMSPQYVKPYVKRNKNDANDAEGICEACTRPTMRFVPTKTVEQQDILGIHRVKSRLTGDRTKLANQIRGLLQEHGIVIPKGISAIRKIPLMIEEGINELTASGRELMNELYEEFLLLNNRIKKYEDKINLLSKNDKRCVRLQTIPGIGKVTATAIVATVGEGEVFQKGRHFSAWLGLVPKQNSSGEKTNLLGISKRGDRYLRELLVHGARAVVAASIKKNKTDRFSLWIRQLVARCGINKAVVAIANKNARIAWALLANKCSYNAGYACGFDISLNLQA
jgi:transposase